MPYHSIYSEHGLRRPRRSICLQPWTLLPAALVGLIAGIAIAGIVGHAARQGEARPVNCLIRSPAPDGLLPAALTPLSGICRVER
jgi:hypothetical protein